MYNFKYHIPDSIEESIDIFNKAEFPKYLAGGMTIIPSMKQNLSTPSDLIDLQNINELNGISISEKKNILVGALTTHNQLSKSSLIKNNIPGLSYLASKIADNAIRNLGTIGGSICNADPAADYPAALLSLDATINTNIRTIMAKDFFVDMFETSLETNEIVKSITFPIRKNSYYLKVSSQASKYAIIGIFGCFFDNSVFVATTGISYKASLMEEFRKLSLNELRNFDYSILNLNNLNFNNDIHASADYRKSLLINKLPILISELLKNE